MPIIVGIICILFFYWLSVWLYRGVLYSIILYQMNKSAVKKREKGQSLKERFLYSRFRDVLPRFAVIWYFVIVAIHPPFLAAYIILTLAGAPEEIWKWVFLSPFLFDLAWIIVIYVMFWQSKPGFKIDRWIKKKRGMKK